MANTQAHQRHLPKMDANIISSLLTFSLSKGLSQEELEACIGVPITTVLENDVRIPVNAMINTWQLLNDRFPNSPLGFELMQATSYSSLPPIVQGMRYAKDLREALTLLSQHSELMSDRLELAFIETQNSAQMNIEHPVNRFINGHMSEYSSLMMLRLLNDISVKDFQYEKIHFVHSRNTSHDAYEAHFSAPVHFLQSSNTLYFIDGSLDNPLRESNAELFSYIKSNLSKKLERIRRPDDSPIATLIMAVAHNAALGEFSAQAAARRANMSLRAAQRLASQHGKTLKALIDEERIHIAKQALRTRNLDMESISMLSGYSDERALRRAFKRMVQLSPAEYRDSLI